MLELRVETVNEPGPLSVIYSALDELARRYGPGADADHLELEEMTPPEGTFVVAREDGHVLGGVGVRTIIDAPSRIGEVKRLWVRPDRRRQGIAAKLMGSLAAESRSLGFAELYLETGERQPEAIAFYHSIGWRRVKSLPDGAFSYPQAERFYLAL